VNIQHRTNNVFQQHILS